MRAIGFLKKVSAAFFVVLTAHAVLAAQTVLTAQAVLAAEPDAIEIDALKYSHKKRFAEITPYVLLTSLQFESDRGDSIATERVGAGASVVVKSYNHLLLEAGLAYVPMGVDARDLGSVELNYLAAPLNFKFFTRDTNLGFFFKSALVPSYLISAQNGQDRFKNSDTQIWVGAGGLFSSQMQNRIYFDLVWARSLSTVMKSESLYNEGIIFSAGLTL